MGAQQESILAFPGLFRSVLILYQDLLPQTLQADVRREHAIGQAVLQRRLFELIADYGACTNCLGGAGGRKDDTLAYVDLPIHNLLFDGAEMWRLDYTDFTQGVGTLCVE